ncbi:heavy-metal-associated domain-containing protein [Kordia zhangzhouensis]|uniref:heavy-metal-associated domain-containing protein n=1 Tax=Kordia zhangzhouensis TaxID=1620405 RepID=UPI000629042F|nr:cation transporter [Kordia zhangzhouensis]
MKKIIVSALLIASVTFVSCNGEAKKEEKTTTIATTQSKELSMANFGVRGNCGMCKTTIEKAATSLNGVSTATWDVKKKSIEVAYDENVVNEETIHKAIAAAGYDTEKATGDKEAYKKLPKCCQYDNSMEMNQEL